MDRYTVLTGRDAHECLYWSIYDRAARLALHHRPQSAADAWRLADSLNRNPGADA